jgi:hypothetical protein
VRIEPSWPIPFGDGTTARRIADIAERIIDGHRSPRTAAAPAR